jgi:hypothetical protein
MLLASDSNMIPKGMALAGLARSSARTKEKQGAKVTGLEISILNPSGELVDGLHSVSKQKSYQ